MLGLKGGPLVAHPHVLEKVGSSATERETMGFGGLVFSQRPEARGQARWTPRGLGVHTVSTEGDPISNTSFWRLQARSAALLSLGLPRTHNLDA